MSILTWKEYKKRFSGSDSCTYFDNAPQEIMRELMKLNGFRLLAVYKYDGENENAEETVKTVLTNRAWGRVVYREYGRSGEQEIEIYVL